MHIVSAIVNETDTVVITVDCMSLRCLMYVLLYRVHRQLSRSIRCAGGQHGQVASVNNYRPTTSRCRRPVTRHLGIRLVSSRNVA